MNNILQQINDITSGSAIIVGGVSKWLNGYTDTYDKKWIDVTIPSSSIEQIKSLGRYIELPSGTTFPPPTLDQFIVKVVPEGVSNRDGWVLDVFVEDVRPDYTAISGSNVITPQADLDWHIALSGSLPNETTHQKVVDRKELYKL